MIEIFKPTFAKVAIIVALFTPIWLPISMYIETIYSCRYIKTKAWVINNQQIKSFTGKRVDISAPLGISGNSVSHRYPGKNGDANVRLRVKGTIRDVLVDVDLSQDYETEQWTLITYKIYASDYSMIPTMNVPDMEKDSLLYSDTILVPVPLQCQ